MATVWLHREDCEADRLPDLCLRCGQPTMRRLAKDFRTTLLWFDPLTLLLGGVEGWTVRVPLCERHSLFWCRNNWGLPACMFVLQLGLFAVVYHASEDGPSIVPLCLCALYMPFFLVVFLGLLGLLSIRAVEMHENGVRLINVHKDFVKAYESQTPAGRDQAADE
jgi:hypothetical protein